MTMKFRSEVQGASSDDLRVMHRFFGNATLRRYYAGLLSDLESELAERGEPVDLPLAHKAATESGVELVCSHKRRQSVTTGHSVCIDCDALVIGVEHVRAPE